MFGLKVELFCQFVLVSWGLFGALFSAGFRYACPLEFGRFGRGAKKAHMAFDL